MSSQKQKPFSYLPLFLAGAVVLVFVIIVFWIIFFPGGRVWTNDAYVTSHYTVVASRVPGQIQNVYVDDNEMVKPGQVLAQLDPRDYQAALDMARAQLERDRALVLDAQANINRQPAIILEKKAEVQRVEAQLKFSRLNARRFGNLALTGAGSKEQGQSAHANMQQLIAQLAAAQAEVDAQEKQKDVLKAKHAAALKTLKQDEARVNQAELNLSYTTIKAPFTAMVGEKSLQVGNYVSPGTALMALVPMDDLWIRANYREISLKHVQPGQKARIHVDAYNIDLKGIVDSIPPASGAAFAPIAPENATGNFTKIVQRLPVKIVVAKGQPLAKLLRMGFSVETTIFTDNADVVGNQARTSVPVTAK